MTLLKRFSQPASLTKNGVDAREVSFVMSICGIYAIENVISGKIYIGQSNNIKRRLQEHKYKLKKGYHRNIHLQNAWNKYGSANFTFEILGKCSIEEINEKETFYITKYKEKFEIYNFTDGGDGTRGYNHTEKTKEKISKLAKGRTAWNKGIPWNKEVKQLISKAKTGKTSTFKGKHHSEESRKKLSDAAKGHPPATGNKGKTQSKESNLKRSETLKGRVNGPLSEETKKKLSESLKGRSAWNKGIPRTGEEKISISAGKKGRPNGHLGMKRSEETKQRLSRPKSDEQKRKQSEVMKDLWKNKKQEEDLRDKEFKI